ncbi:MAG: PQQ-binding-like beta-propeller repeat protein [bacterium]
MTLARTTTMAVNHAHFRIGFTALLLCALVGSCNKDPKTAKKSPATKSAGALKPEPQPRPTPQGKNVPPRPIPPRAAALELRLPAAPNLSSVPVRYTVRSGCPGVGQYGIGLEAGHVYRHVPGAAPVRLGCGGISDSNEPGEATKEPRKDTTGPPDFTLAAVRSGKSDDHGYASWVIYGPAGTILTSVTALSVQSMRLLQGQWIVVEMVGATGGFQVVDLQNRQNRWTEVGLSGMEPSGLQLFFLQDTTLSCIDLPTAKQVKVIALTDVKEDKIELEATPGGVQARWTHSKTQQKQTQTFTCPGTGARRTVSIGDLPPVATTQPAARHLFRGGAARTGVYGPQPPPARVVGGVLRWTLLPNMGMSASPAIHGNTAFIGDWEGGLGAVDIPTGKVHWRVDLADQPIRGSVAIGPKGLYVGSNNGSLYAVRRATGKQLWRQRTGGPIFSTAAVADGVVTVGSYDGHVYAFDAASGARKWKTRLDGQVWASPLVIAGTIVVPSYARKPKGHLYGLDAKTGAVKWKLALPGGSRSSPAAAGGRVFLGATDGHVYSVALATRRIIWRFNSGGEIPGTPAVRHGMVFVGSYSGHLNALRADTGQVLWRFAVPKMKKIFASPAVHAGVVYMTAKDWRLYAIAARDGKQLWSRRLEGAVDSSPAISPHGTLLLGVHRVGLVCMR